MIGDEPIWPVDLGELRLWPMEGEDGPLLQELFNDLTDFEVCFGERGEADAISSFVALPEGYGYGYDAKLLVGVWLTGGLAGAIDCIMRYSAADTWTVGLLVVAERHRRQGFGSAVLDWIEQTCRDRGGSVVPRPHPSGQRGGPRVRPSARLRPRRFRI